MENTNSQKRNAIIVIALLAVFLLAGTASLFLFDAPSSDNGISRPRPTATPEITGKPTPFATEIPTVTNTPVPLATQTPIPTTIPALAWKDFSFQTSGDPWPGSHQITGKVPTGTSLENPVNGNPGEMVFKGTNFTITISLVPHGEILTYTSYKYLPKHPQFGDVFRFRYASDGANLAHYSNHSMTKIGNCSYVGEEFNAPCGGDIIGTNFSGLRIDCQAELSVRDSVCDKFVGYLRIN